MAGMLKDLEMAAASLNDRELHQPDPVDESMTTIGLPSDSADCDWDDHDDCDGWDYSLVSPLLYGLLLLVVLFHSSGSPRQTGSIRINNRLNNPPAPLPAMQVQLLYDPYSVVVSPTMAVEPVKVTTTSTPDKVPDWNGEVILWLGDEDDGQEPHDD